MRDAAPSSATRRPGAREATCSGGITAGSTTAAVAATSVPTTIRRTRSLIAPKCGKRRGACLRLFDGDGLRQFARLVHVEAAEPRDAVGEELQRERRERRLEERMRPRDV